MANTKINTRILLRNDLLANWNASSLVLEKGEVAIATDIAGNLAEVRVGTGSSTWANSLKLAVDPSQISGLTSLIDTEISSIALQYQLSAGTGNDANKWILQSRPLSGGAWTDVSTLDLTQLTGYALSTDVDTAINAAIEDLSGTVDAKFALSADVTKLVGDAIDGLSTTVDADYLKKTDFNTISTTIGLDAASSTNKVVTLSDIADLAGAMHFRGAVTPTEGQSDEAAIAAYYTSQSLTPEAGDVVIITTNSKEYVYNGTQWIELGAEDLYATKAEVATVSAELTSDIEGLTNDVSYLSGQIEAISAQTLLSANAYTDGEIAKLSADRFALSTDVVTYVGEEIGKLDVTDTEGGNADAGFVTKVTETDGKVAVTKKTLQLSDITDYTETLSAYALSADVDTLVAATSAATYTSATTDANDYTDQQIDALSSGFLILDCGGSTLRPGEPTADKINA